MTPTTFVCCIESGPLETITLRMIESLRRFGGAWKESPVIAVKPRMGPDISEATRQALDRLNTEFVHFRANGRHSWNNFMNKPHALVYAEQKARTTQVGWLDSDLLFLDEPALLDLTRETDLLACPSDKNVGSSGPDDPHDTYWKELCDALGIELDSLPWVTTCVESERIRLYFNSGLFVFRTGKGFTDAYLQDCEAILRSRLASHSSGIFFTDQVALGLTAHRLGMKWQSLPHEYNYAVGSKIPEAYNAEAIAKVVVLHHHDALWHPNWQMLMQTLREARPEVASWLEPLGPLSANPDFISRIVGKILRMYRNMRLASHMRRCRVV